MLLVTAAFALLAGLLAAELFSYLPVITLSVILLVGLFVFRKTSFRWGIVVAGIGFALLLWKTEGPDDLRYYLDQGPIRLVARVIRPPQHSPDRVVLQMEAQKGQTPEQAEETSGQNRTWHPLKGFFRVTILKPETPFAYGDLIDMEVALTRPRQFENPGNFPYADYLERQGMAGVVTLSKSHSMRKVGEERQPWLAAITRFRDAIRHKMLADLADPVGTILLAMVIGEAGYLSDSTRDTFADSGTTHILSISGSHLAMISFFVFGLVRWVLIRLPAPILLRLSLFKLPSQWAALIAAGVVTFYALLSGMAVATERSLIMILIYLISIWIGRWNDIKIALGLAALIFLAFSPTVLFDISFQLSYLSVFFIILVSDRWKRPSPSSPLSRIQKQVTRPLTLLVLSSVGAILGTLPLTLYYFHQFSWVGLISNLVVIPFVGVILLPFALGSAIAAPFFNHFPFASLHHALGLFYMRITSLFADLPCAHLHFASPHIVTIALFYLIVPALLIRRVSTRLVGGVTALFLVIFLVGGSIRLPPKTMQVTFLDVGQGDSALIEFPKGTTMLVDAGSGEPVDVGKRAITPFLWEKKIRRLDYLVGTHPQNDHMGGMASLIQKFEVGTVVTNGIRSPLPFYRSFWEAVHLHGIRQEVARAGQSITIEDCTIVFLNPHRDHTLIRSVDPTSDMNDESLVFRLSCSMGGAATARTTFLFTADIGRKGMERIIASNIELKADILKVPHHGSRGSLSNQFLSAVSPKMAIISAGLGNRYGHPHLAVITAYDRFRVPIYRTDWNGAVTVIPSATGFDVRKFSETRMQKIRWSREILLQEFANLHALGR
jgi:competence protein ComEC